MNSPIIVCLCGSTRFYEAFQRANYEETMAGKIVLTVGHYPNATGMHCQNYGCTPEQKVALDELHLRKIDLADEVLILNVGGYIGESTARELAYAKAKRKKAGTIIRFLEPDHQCEFSFNGRRCVLRVGHEDACTNGKESWTDRSNW